jgi:hypothetical protein
LSCGKKRTNSPEGLESALRDLEREKEELEAKMNAQSLKPFPYTGLPAYVNLTLDEAKPTEKLRLDWQQLTDKIAHIQLLLDSVPSAELGKELVREPVGTASERCAANPGAGGQSALQGVASTEPWHKKLRAARKKADLSRPAAAQRLKTQGVTITSDAIKKHEEGKAKPKPDTRKAYAVIYKTPEGELFPPGE